MEDSWKAPQKAVTEEIPFTERNHRSHQVQQHNRCKGLPFKSELWHLTSLPLIGLIELLLVALIELPFFGVMELPLFVLIEA